MPFYASDMPWMNPSDVIKATGTEMTRLSSPLPDPRFTQPPVRGFTVPPNTQAVIPRMNMQPALSTTGGVPSTAVRNLTKGFTLGRTGQTISDAVYRELPKQRALPAGAIRTQIGYTPAREAITSQEALGNIRRFSKPYAQQAMEDVVQTASKAAKGLSKVAKAGIGGGVGAVLTDMLFPDSANQVDDVAMIRNYKPLQSQGTTTPQAVGFPALQQMPNQAEFEKEFRKSQEMKESDYGKVPGTGYFQVEGQPRKYYMGDAAKATGGFSRPSTADANLAQEEAEYQQSREINARRAALDAQELQQSLAQRAQSAIASGDYRQAAALGQMLQQAGGLQVDDYGTQQLAQAQAKVLPQSQQQKTALEGAQARWYEAQAAGLPQANAIKAAQALQQARAKLAENDARTLDAVLKAGDPNAVMALGAYPQFRNFVAAYLAAQEASKE